MGTDLARFRKSALHCKAFRALPGLGYPGAVIRVAVSHRMEELLEALVEAIATERLERGALEPIDLVLPNRNLETFLRQRLAEKLGIAANLRTFFLRRYLTERGEGGRIAHADILQGNLLALFHDQRFLMDPALAPIRHYLDGGGADEDSRDRRRVDLAARLAQLFDEYTASRAEMVKQWMTDTTLPLDPEEHWQCQVWRWLWGKEGRLGRDLEEGKRFQSLEAWVAQVAPSAPSTPVHIFGVSYLAPAYHRMLAILGKRQDVRVYALVPCKEDPQALRARPIVGSDDPYGLLAGTSAVALWGRPSRENLRLLLAQPRTTLVPLAFAPNPGGNLLASFQNHVVNQTRPAEPLGSGDDSVRIFPCPSPRREVETVAGEIWRLLGRDPTLRVPDILVVVPEGQKDLYFSHIPTVFGESGDLPHSLSDLSALESHPMAHAIRLLLELPFAPPTRKALLPLLTHPCLLSRFPGVDPARFPEMLDELGIVREANAGDFPPGYLSHDRFSFEQGLRRLALGAFLRGEEPMALDGQDLAPGPVGPEMAEFAALGLLCRSLLADARFAKGLDAPATRPLSEWLDFIAGMMTGYLVVDEDDPAGKALLARFLSELANLADLGLGETPVRFRIAARLAERCLQGVPWGRGQYLASGVTVASFVPMRSIPFRAVFILGLSQGQFPRRAGRGELDLRRHHRLAGDVDDGEQDAHLFLETLLSARDFLGLSYVARNEVTGDSLPPSKLLQDLRVRLGDGFLSPADLGILFQDDPAARPPLRRHEDPARRHALPAAVAEHQAARAGARLRLDGDARARIARLPRHEQSALERLLRLPPLIPPRPFPPGETIAVTLNQLYRFLVDPLQGGARFGLGLYRVFDEGLRDVEDEPMVVDARSVARTVERACEEALLARQGLPPLDTLRADFRALVAREELRGALPGNLLGQPFYDEGDRQLETIHGLIARDAPTTCRRYLLRGGEGRDPRPHLPPLRLDLPSGGVAELVGESSLIVTTATDDRLSLRLANVEAPTKQSPGQEDLRTFLDHVVLSVHDEREHQSHVVYTKGKAVTEDRHRFAKLAAQPARDYLARLVDDLCFGGGAALGIHPYLLPHEAVFKARAEELPVARAVSDLVNQAIESEYPKLSTLRGSVPDPLDRYSIPDDANAEAMAEARFGLFFELLQREDA